MTRAIAAVIVAVTNGAFHCDDAGQRRNKETKMMLSYADAQKVLEDAQSPRTNEKN
jgi:hypothetical protein